MASQNGNLEQYFTAVQQDGQLRSPAHARRWSTSVLKTLGFHLNRGLKKSVANQLPEPLAADLTRVFWLLHFRDQTLTAHEFLDQVARRSGNTDPQFARMPTLAVFGQIKQMVNAQTRDQVAEALSPEVRELWQQA
ncbi:MAG: DUF2267 domain-containing protein [Anaerolineales bacterium]|nr:DUF2267 domain-containing protein [Anaerolineales bacterium]